MFSESEKFYLDKIRAGLRLHSHKRLSDSENDLLGTDVSDPKVLQGLQSDECRETAARCVKALRTAYDNERELLKARIKVEGMRESSYHANRLKEWWRQYEKLLADSQKFISGIAQVFYVEQRKAEQLEKARAREDMKKAIGCASSAVIFICMLTIVSVAVACIVID